MQVRYLALAQCRRLRIQCCHNCGLSRDCGLDQIPSRGAPYVTGWPKIKGGKKKRGWGKEEERLGRWEENQKPEMQVRKSFQDEGMGNSNK